MSWILSRIIVPLGGRLCNYRSKVLDVYLINNQLLNVRNFYINSYVYQQAGDDAKLVRRDIFEEYEQKNREAFLDLIYKYKHKLKKTGHVEFIYAAMKKMEHFGVHEDIEVYKQLIEVLPKERFVPKNWLQAEYFYFPRQQEVIVDLLQQMEENGVIPDWDMEELLLSIFGKRGYPLRRYWRMMYWMPKFKNNSPWPVPKPTPKDPLQLAKLAISRINTVDLKSELSVFYTNTLEDTTEDAWIVSSQSPEQKGLLNEHPIDIVIYIEGPFLIWLRRSTITYFVLRANPIKSRKVPVEKDPDDISNLEVPLFYPPSRNAVIPELTLHEQKDGIIYATCATRTSSKESLLSWIKLLEKNGNPRIKDIPIVFKVKSTTDIESDNILLQDGTSTSTTKSITDS